MPVRGPSAVTSRISRPPLGVSRPDRRGHPAADGTPAQPCLQEEPRGPSGNGTPSGSTSGSTSAGPGSSRSRSGDPPMPPRMVADRRPASRSARAISNLPATTGRVELGLWMETGRLDVAPKRPEHSRGRPVCPCEGRMDRLLARAGRIRARIRTRRSILRTSRPPIDRCWWSWTWRRRRRPPWCSPHPHRCRSSRARIRPARSRRRSR